MKPIFSINGSLRTSIAAVFYIVFAALSNMYISTKIDPGTEAGTWMYAIGSGVVALLVAAGWFYLVGAKNEADKFAETKAGKLTSIDKLILVIFTPAVAFFNLWY